MADADDETTTAPPPAAPAPTAATPDMLAQAQQIAQQFLPAPVQVDTTPVKRSFLSLLGEAVGGGKTIPMSPTDEQRAGLRALGDFGTSLMAASHYQPGQTVFSNLAQGFQGAERSMTGSEQMAAGTLAAQQGYQQQQLQNRLEALKQAIPLLRMQQAAGMPNPLAGGGGGAPGGGIAATGAPITGTGLNAAGDSATRKAAEGGPPAPDTPAAAVAQRTHDFWISQGYTEPQVAGIMAGGPGSESDFNSTVSGDKGTSYGLYQYHGERLANMQKYFGLPAGQMPSEAQQNQYAAFEISPKGPLASVGTQLQGAKTPAEAATIWTGGFGVPADKSEIARRANGANRYLGIYGQPPAQGGSATAGAPPASTAPPSPVARPTAAPATPSGTIQGTPDTGGTQVGGPGALPGVIRPPGPLVPGDVGAIVGGMTKAGASPTTLAPGGGTAAPTAPTIAQGGPPTVTPPAQPTPQQPAQGDQPPAPTGPLTIEQYRAMHPTVIAPETYTVTPPPAALADAQAAKQTAAQNLQQARIAGDVNAANKAQSDFTIASQNVNKLQQDAQSKSLELRQAAQKNADDLTLQGYNAEMQRQQEAQLKAQELAQTVAENEKNRQAQIALETLKGQQGIQLEQAKGRTADESKVMQGLDETRETARSAIDQIGLARSLSQQAGDPTFWQTVQQSHPQLVQALANMGALSNDQVTQLGYAGATDAAMNKLISMARTGSGFQRMTNLDVQILSSQAPKAVDPQAWREAKMDYLQTYMAHQMQYVDNVRSLRADGTPLYQAQKQAATDGGDIVPTIPTFNDTPQKTAVQQRIDWAQKTLSPNTFFRAPDGQLQLWAPTAAPAQSQQPQPSQPQRSLVPTN